MLFIIQQFLLPRKRSYSTTRLRLTRSILVLLVVGAMVAFAPRAARSAEPEVVARVNGEPVSRAELQRMLADPLTELQLQQEHGVRGVRGAESKDLERLALRMLVHRRLLLQEAARRNLAVTEAELDQAITSLRRRFKDLRDFGAWMNEQGLDDRSLFETLRAEMLATRIRAALVEGVRPAEEQVREYYETHKEELKTAGEVRLRIIAVKDKEAAEEILAELKKGGNFAGLARKRSLGMRAAQGGDTGWVAPQTLPSPLREAVGTLKAGDAVGPLQRDGDFLIVGLAGRRPERTKSLAEARSEIERRLLPAKQQEALQAWLAQQERKSKIEVLP
jgi:parvulin-like peptidyl-prolyl isomerase